MAPRRPAKPGRKPWRTRIESADPDGLPAHVRRFSQWQLERNYSCHTVDHREKVLDFFVTWCAERGLMRPQEITKPILERYQRHLFLHRKANGQPLSAATQAGFIRPVQALFKYLAKQNHILYNPASELELPRQERRLPRHILSVAEVEKVMAVPDLTTPMGVRNRAVLETFYSTGMRRLELIGLKVWDIDAERGTVMIRQGKGKKDRLIPIGERALAWIDKYLADVRPNLACGAGAAGGDGGTLFLSHFGEAFSPIQVTGMVGKAVAAADIGKKGACHLFRHTMATLMLENGADIRFIQAMLGHSELNSTQIYTQVATRQLKAIHTATHPAKPIRSRLAARQDAQHDAGSAGDEAEALLALLDAEADEEDAGSEA